MYDRTALGLQAIDALCREQYAMIFMDSQMPNMDHYLAKPVKLADLHAVIKHWSKPSVRVCLR